MNKKTIGQALIGLAFGYLAMALLEDEWAGERFERYFREMARLNRPLLEKVDSMNHYRQMLGSAMCFSFVFAYFKHLVVLNAFCFIVILRAYIYSSPYIILFSHAYAFDAIT